MNSEHGELVANDKWQSGAKVRWARMLNQRPLAVVDLDCVTIAGRFAPLSITLKECPGIYPLGWFDFLAEADNG